MRSVLFGANKASPSIRLATEMRITARATMARMLSGGMAPSRKALISSWPGEVKVGMRSS